jgi:rhodanese-related sulfurtransferase
MTKLNRRYDSMGVMSWLMGMGCEELSPQEIKAMKQSGEKFVLVDVRTPEEHSRRKIEGSRLIPLQEMERRAGEIPKDKEVVLYCANGFRSLVACRYLKKLGYKVKNMTGGINRW